MDIKVNFNGKEVLLSALTPGETAHAGGYYGSYISKTTADRLRETGKYDVDYVRDTVLDMNGLNDNSHYRIFVKPLPSGKGTVTKISEDMVDEFNATMKNVGSSIRLAFGATSAPGNTQCKLTLESLMFVSSFSISPTPEFYSILENFFKQRGIEELSFNNTGCIFFSKNGWSEQGMGCE